MTIVYCDQCDKHIGEDRLAYSSDREKNEDFCSEDCCLKWNERVACWRNVHPDFASEFQEWENKGFTHQTCKEWIDIGLTPWDADYVVWLRDVKEVGSDWVLNNGDNEELRMQYQRYLFATQFRSTSIMGNRLDHNLKNNENLDEIINAYRDKGISGVTAGISYNLWIESNELSNNPVDGDRFVGTFKSNGKIYDLRTINEEAINLKIFVKDISEKVNPLNGNNWEDDGLLDREEMPFPEEILDDAFSIHATSVLLAHFRAIKQLIKGNRCLDDGVDQEFMEHMEILQQFTQITQTINDANKKLDQGWLTDDNIEYILENHPDIQQTLIGQNQWKVRTDIANIRDVFYKAKNNQVWDLSRFLQGSELYRYTIFPLRVLRNHWGMFILENNGGSKQVYYASSLNPKREVKQIKPLIKQLTNSIVANNNIQIIQATKQNNDYDCGVYLIKYIQEFLETGNLTLTRNIAEQDCQNFRQEWKHKIGEEKWCKIDATNDIWQEKRFYNVKNIYINNNIMTNKELIIQWEGVELRDETDEYCESFAVIAGCDEKSLSFDRDFFIDTEYSNSFQKGKIYKFSFNGELKKSSDNFIESIEEGGFEINEISEMVSFIRDTYKEKEKALERKNLIEKELEEKNNTIQDINKERFEAKKELAELKIKFDGLQFEKTEIENKWTNPEKHKELLSIQKELEEKLKAIKEENRKLSGKLEEISKQDWNTTLVKKIQSKKEELEKLKDKTRDSLDNNMLKSALEVYLTANEQLTVLRMESVDERICSPTKKQMERSEANLRKKITLEELQGLCRVHSEAIKMEIQQKQWEEWKAQEQQFEAYVEVPITIDL